MRGPQGDRRLQRHGSGLERLHAPSPGQRREHQDPLHPREGLADADARAATEGEVGKLRPAFLPLGQPAIGVEPIRIGKKPRVAVQQVLREEHDRPFRDQVPADLHVVYRAPADAPGRWIEPHRLGHHHARVGKVRRVRGGGRTATEHGVYLLVQPALDLRVLREQIPCPRERVRGRFVAGEEDRHRLVAHLRIAHPAAVAFFVARQQQHRQQIAAVIRRRAPLVDDPVDQPVERRLCTVVPADGRQRQALEDRRKRRHRHRKRLEDRRQRLAHRPGVRVEVGAEQRFADDRQREAVHFAGDVEGLAVAPPRRRALRVRHHRVRVGGNALLVESRLREPALAAMEIGLARQQPFAEQPFRALERTPFLEQARARHQHVLDVVGMVQQHEPLRPDPEGGDVAVLAREPRQRAEPVALQRAGEQQAEERTARAWRGVHGTD